MPRRPPPEKTDVEKPGTPKPPIIPPPPKVTARAMRPLWRDLILSVWGADPLQCPCWQATMQCVGTIVRPAEVQFFLRLHGMWEGVIDLPPPPDPPFDIETFEPIAPPGRPSANRSQTTMPSRVSTCSTSASHLESQPESPSKTVPSSSSIRTDATESAEPEITAAKNFEK